MSVLSKAFRCIITEMLKVIGYQHSAKLFNHLRAEIGSDAALIVTSNPLKADSLRLKWANHSRLDVVTFSKFSTTLSEKLNPTEVKVAWRKSKLLLQLNAFKNLLPQGKNLSYSEFKAAYQIFSDLRAYVPAQDFPDEILMHFDENVALLAQLFHQAARNLDILDEHTGTLYLAEELRKPEGLVLDTGTIVFEGFSFLTPVQISLVEALSIRHQVLIPIPQKVLDHAHPFDWTSIIKDSCDEYISDVQVENLEKSLQFNIYPSGSLLSVLKKKLEASNDQIQLILSSKRIDAVIEQGMPVESFQKKMPVDILLEEREKVFSELEEICFIKKKLSAAPEILSVIDEQLAFYKKSPSLAGAKSIAVLQLIKNACLSLPNILEQQKLDDFLFHLLRDVVSLDSPRNNLISMSMHSQRLELMTIKDTHLVDPSLKAILCIDSQFGNIMSDSRAFSPKLEKELAKLGPVRRPELEFLFLESNLEELWGHPQMDIFLEEGVLEHDVGWKRIFSQFSLSSKKLSFEAPNTKADFSFFKSMPLAHDTKYISASRLQDFLDCPKKYHASRIDKITPLVRQSSEVDVMNLGNIEHELIKIGWEKGEGWWENITNLEKEAERLLVEKFDFKNLNPISLAGAAHEASLYSLNGILKLKLITSKLEGSKVVFALNLDHSKGRRGEIDCLIISPKLDLILDFKRSKGQNPSLTQFRNGISKIQLWFYLNSIEILEKKNYGVGYLFLKDIQDSWIICSTESCDLLEEDFPKRVAAWDSFDTQLAAYQAFELEAIDRWRTEKDFLPNPSSKQICSFCDLNSICTKSNSDDEDDE